jgi:hypothetical protein
MIDDCMRDLVAKHFSASRTQPKIARAELDHATIATVASNGAGESWILRDVHRD